MSWDRDRPEIRCPGQCHRCQLLLKKEFETLTGPFSHLCRDYAAIVFFANNRFETGKKKLQYLSFGDFAYCAELMIQNWTLGAVGEAHTHAAARTPPQLPRACVPTSSFSCRPRFPATFLLYADIATPSPVSPLHSSSADRVPATDLWPGASHSALLTLPFLSHGGVLRGQAWKAWDITGDVFTPTPIPLLAFPRLPGG